MKYTKEVKQAIKSATSINIRMESGVATLEVCNDQSSTISRIGMYKHANFFCYNATYNFAGVGNLLHALLRIGDELSIATFHKEDNYKYCELRITRNGKYLCEVPFNFDHK